MIDLHTHTVLSDGDLVPSELVRRAQVNGHTAIALTDHVDYSNIDVVLSGLVKVAEELNRRWDIFVIPGIEITHVPLDSFEELTIYARKNGAKIVVAHGESPVEPVIPGTNTAAINADVDILAHPGFITEDDARLAAERGVYLEITSRRGHRETNQHVFDIAIKTGAGLVLNTDSHSPGDILTLERRDEILKSLTKDESIRKRIIKNSETIVKKIKEID